MAAVLVSVPIRGSFNLIGEKVPRLVFASIYSVSVPIRGSFNLIGARGGKRLIHLDSFSFRPHQGII